MALTLRSTRPQEITTEQFVDTALQTWLADRLHTEFRPAVSSAFAAHGLTGPFTGTIETQLNWSKAPADWANFLDLARSKKYEPRIVPIEQPEAKQEDCPIILICRGDQLPDPKEFAIWQGTFAAQVPLPKTSDFMAARIKEDVASTIVKRLNQWFTERLGDVAPVFVVNADFTWASWFWNQQELARGARITAQPELTIRAMPQSNGQPAATVAVPDIGVFDAALTSGIKPPREPISGPRLLVEVLSPVTFGKTLDEPRYEHFRTLLTDLFRRSGLQTAAHGLRSAILGGSQTDDLQEQIRVLLEGAKGDREPSLSAEQNAALGLGNSYVENARKKHEAGKKQKEQEKEGPAAKLRQLIMSWQDQEREIPRAVRAVASNDLGSIAVILKNEARWPDAAKRLEEVIGMLAADHASFANELRPILAQIAPPESESEQAAAG